MSAGIRDFVKQISPPWLSAGVAEKLLYVLGLAVDANLEKLNQGMRLHLPTYGDPSALPFVGADRLIPQGLNEPAAGYAQRLKFWLDDWQIAGNVRSVLHQILGQLTPQQPMVRTVSNTSVWDTWIDGASSQTTFPSRFKGAANWNWDNDGDPHPLGRTMWWRWWLILYTGMTPVGTAITAATNALPIAVTTSSPHGLATGAKVWVDGVAGNLGANGGWTIVVTGPNDFTLTGSTGTGAWTSGGIVLSRNGNDWCSPGPVFGAPGVVIGPPTGGQTAGPWATVVGGQYVPLPTTGTPPLAIGFAQPPTTFVSLRGIVSLWKGAHSWCRWMIVSFDQNEFSPSAGVGGVNPDGTWGPWATVVGNQYVATRYANARYCDGAL